MGSQLAVPTTETKTAVEARVGGLVLEGFDADEFGLGGSATGKEFDAEELGANVAAEELRG